MIIAMIFTYHLLQFSLYSLKIMFHLVTFYEKQLFELKICHFCSGKLYSSIKTLIIDNFFDNMGD